MEGARLQRCVGFWIMQGPVGFSEEAGRWQGFGNELGEKLMGKGGD